MSRTSSIIPIERIERTIYMIRGQKVMLDCDLAELYGVETKALNRAIDRNKARFPEDFVFYMTNEEWKILKCQIGTSKKGSGGKQKLPRVFTEHGAYATAFTLRSPRAQTMSIQVIRTFIQMREFIYSNKVITKEVNELKSFALKHSKDTSQEFRRVWSAIEKLSPSDNKRSIGFKLE